MSCSVGRRRSSDRALLWLWSRLATVALIRRLAWELPYAMSMALKSKKKKEKKERKEEKRNLKSELGRFLVLRNSRKYFLFTASVKQPCWSIPGDRSVSSTKECFSLPVFMRPCLYFCLIQVTFLILNFTFQKSSWSSHCGSVVNKSD